MSALRWHNWNGADWHGDPEALVHVRFGDGQSDEHLPASSAMNLGLAGETSNWRWGSRPGHSGVVAYALSEVSA